MLFQLHLFLCAILNGLNAFYTKLSGKSLACLSKSDFFNPLQSKFTSQAQIIEILQLTLGVAMNCDQRQDVITRITQMDEETMEGLQETIEHIN